MILIPTYAYQQHKFWNSCTKCMEMMCKSSMKN